MGTRPKHRLGAKTGGRPDAAPDDSGIGLNAINPFIIPTSHDYLIPEAENSHLR